MRLCVRWLHVCAGEEKRTLRKSAFCVRPLTEKRILDGRRHGKAHSACEPGCAERPFSPICVHSCVPTAARATGRGPRVPRRRRPHGPRDARALGPEAHAAGAVTQPPTHTSSRSLIFDSDMHDGGESKPARWDPTNGRYVEPNPLW